MKRFKSFIFGVLGTIFLALGILGMVLPLLPTTPFLLLAAYCYAKSSERLYGLLTENRYLGRYIKDWRDGKGIPLKSKITAIVMLAAAAAYSLIAVEMHLALKILFFLVASGVTVYIMTRPTRKPN